MNIPGLEVERRHSKILERPLAAPRGGIMLHYDDSSRDDWAVEWFSDPRCTNGYTWLVLDDGRIVELADPAYRTPHAGACRTPMANSVFYGIAAATNGLTLATASQLEAVAMLSAAVARFENWSIDEIGRRIVGHDLEAIWTPDHTDRQDLWGKLGRKLDPTGTRADHRPIIDVHMIRRRVRSIVVGNS
jgi:N-acetyl-anhydromuramyl-L-alanine amidase AmpD